MGSEDIGNKMSAKKVPFFFYTEKNKKSRLMGRS